ncbi:hypothetical protein [Streptomyces sp. NPDC088725]|uniref:SCO2583 family membrane protein n=1 Tax=Streptomyces sp. NPDC088725 TaxID=3365873 RepID=UPI0037F2CBDB
MAERGDPPQGPSEGLPGGSDDEYRSVVFDESFIRAARLQEFSARERMGDHTPAVRTMPPRVSKRGLRSASRQLLMLVLVVTLAFGAAIYLGVRHPYRPPGGDPGAEQPRMTVMPLAPRGPVPGGRPADLFAHSPAARFRSGASGITLPTVRNTKNFTESQVVAALITVKDYLVASSLDPDVLAGRTVQPVRTLIDPDQLSQFDRSLAAGDPGGRHALAGWLVRFDPAQVAPADAQVRVRGTLTVLDRGPGALEVVADHTFVYALRPAKSDKLPVRDASLYVVRREVRFRFDADALQQHRTEVLGSEVKAGPQACTATVPDTLRPLLAGQRAASTGPADTNPYALGTAGAALCGALDPAAEPRPGG